MSTRNDHHIFIKEDSTECKKCPSAKIPLQKYHICFIILCFFFVVHFGIDIASLVLAARGNSFNLNYANGNCTNNNTIPVYPLGYSEVLLPTNRNLSYEHFNNTNLTDYSTIDTEITSTTLPLSPEDKNPSIEDMSDSSAAMELPNTFPTHLLPIDPVMIVDGVLHRRKYYLFSEAISYEMAAVTCRHVMQGGCLISVNSSLDMHLIDTIVNVYGAKIFKNEFQRILWTGGYFDLKSKDPYLLRWMDQPANSRTSYSKFCPSRDVRGTVDRALINLQANRFSHGENYPHRLYVAVDYRPRNSCWQIFNEELILRGARFPFVCMTPSLP